MVIGGISLRNYIEEIGMDKITSMSDLIYKTEIDERYKILVKYCHSKRKKLFGRPKHGTFKTSINWMVWWLKENRYTDCEIMVHHINGRMDDAEFKEILLQKK